MSIQINSEAQRTAEVRERHQQQVRQQIILPMVAVLVVLVVLPPLAFLLIFTGRQVGIIASFATIMLLVPAVMLCVLPYVVMVAGVAGAAKLYARLPDWLRTARNVTHGVNMGSHRVSKAVSVPVIAASKRLAWLERLAGQQPPHAH